MTSWIKTWLLPARPCRFMAVSGLAAVVLTSVFAIPAHADDHRGRSWRMGEQRREQARQLAQRHARWQEQHRYDGYYRRPDVYYSAPPVVYQPPAYYQRPGVSLNFAFPFIR